MAFASSKEYLSERGHTYATTALVHLVGGLDITSDDATWKSLYRRAILLIDTNITEIAHAVGFKYSSRSRPVVIDDLN